MPLLKSLSDRCPVSGKPVRVDPRTLFVITNPAIRNSAMRSGFVCVLEDREDPRVCMWSRGCRKLLNGDRVVQCGFRGRPS